MLSNCLFLIREDVAKRAMSGADKYTIRKLEHQVKFLLDEVKDLEGHKDRYVHDLLATDKYTMCSFCEEIWKNGTEVLPCQCRLVSLCGSCEKEADTHGYEKCGD